MAVSGAVCAICPLFHPHARSLVTGTGKSVIKREARVRKSKNLKKIAVAKTPFCFEATNEGIKACVNAPSAKIRRKRLGSLKATKNISLHTEAPSAEAISTSRPKPVMRETRMPKLLVNIDLSRMIFFWMKIKCILS